MSIEKELGKMIQKAAIDGALNEQAIEHYQAIISENKALKDNLKARTEERDKEREIVKIVQGERDAARQDRDAMAAVFDDVKEREKKITELEIRKECAEQRVGDHQEMFRIVFRNAVVRRDVFTPTSINDNGSQSYTDQHKGEAEEV